VPRVLEDLWVHQAAGAADDLYIPHRNYLLVKQGERVRATARGDFNAGSLLPPGVDVVFVRPGWLEVWCSRTGLVALAADPRTTALHPPFRFQPQAVVSEARHVMDWETYHTVGTTGAGVRVAIIDVDFTGFEGLQGSELPGNVVARSFVDPALEPYREPTRHGTAVAEIVSDLAPEADLFLLTILQASDFPEAVSWCIDNDIDVVSMSLGFSAGPRDGTSFVSAEVDRAARAGILWFNSAGNAGSSHWGGDWIDADGDDYPEFAPGREVIGFTYQSNQSGPLVLLLAEMIWDRWPNTTGLSLDLEIWRDSLRTVLLSSSNGQPSPGLPYRLVALDNPVSNTRYYLAVKRQAGTITAPLRLDIFNDEGAVDMAPRDPFGSLLIPADARGAIAVSAYDYGVVTAGADPVRFYSSRGPTWDGRIKPNLVAADGVSTSTYGIRGFYGTSASAPHAAGAAALLASATVSGGLFTYVWSADDFFSLLGVRSIDFGSAGFDSTYGLGAIVLPPASSRPEDFTVSAYPNPFNAELVIAFDALPGEAYDVRVFDVLGRAVWTQAGRAQSDGKVRLAWMGEAAGRVRPSGVYFYRVETASGRSRTGRAVLLK
jgi:subtilisin family serine protease